MADFGRRPGARATFRRAATTSAPSDASTIPEEVSTVVTPSAPGAAIGVTLGTEQEFAVEARTQWKIVLRRFLRHKPAVVSLFIFVSLILVSIILPIVWKYSYKDFINRPDPYPFKGKNDWLRPSLTHPFGLDREGKEMVAQVLRGLQYSLRIALFVALLATFLGVVIGAISGYYRGWTDSVLMRFVDLALVIPFQLAVATLSTRVKGSNWLWLALFLALFTWMIPARVVRGAFLSLREKEFVEAARAIGAPDRRIIFRHILPNTIGPIIVNVTLAVGAAVLAETALSFIGLGVHAPDTSLGLLIADHEGEFSGLPWLFWWPFAFLVLIVLSINFIGDGLRDAFDPRQTRVRA